MKCNVFMARVHRTRGPRWPMELEILDGKKIKSSCRATQCTNLLMVNTNMMQQHRLNAVVKANRILLEWCGRSTAA